MQSENYEKCAHATAGHSKKYPDSVYTVSALLDKARKEGNEEKEDLRQKLIRCEEIQTERWESPSSESSDSESSTPRVSPTASISYGHHICGSLFAKCAEHGRSPLLETFSNPNSFLSQQTFKKKHLKQKSDAFDELFRKRKVEFSTTTINENVNLAVKDSHGEKEEVQVLAKAEKTIVETPDGSVVSSTKVRFEKNAGKANELHTKPQIKPIQRLIVRRHNSLPNNQLEPEVLQRVKEIFIEANINNLSAGKISRDEDEEDEKQIIESKAFKRGRSKSESKITRFLRSDGKSVEKCIGKEKDVKNDMNEEGCREVCEKCLKTSNYFQTMGSFEDGLIRGKLEKVCTELTEEWQRCACKKEDDKNGNRLMMDMSTCNFHASTKCMRSVLAQLRKENMDWMHKVDFLETEILLLRRELKKRDKENITLQREVNKLRSVLQQTNIFKQEDILSSLQDSHGMPGQVQQVIAVPNPNKKQGVSGESSDNGRKLDQIEIERFEKDFRSKQLIKDAIMENDFLKNLDSSQVREIVDSVYPKEFEKGSYVIKEGEAGSHLYVSAEGEFEVIKDHKILGRMGPGKAFGELAILYNCRRTASIKVASDAKVWVLDRRVFQQIMMKTGLQRLQENINFLRSVPLLQPLNNDVLAKIADVLEVDFYPSGAHIIRQGASGDTFFIISTGRVKVTQQKPGRQEEEEIRILGKGDYFGEQALLKEDWRTANVIALSPGVECLTLDRESFIQLIGDLSELQEKNYEDQEQRSFSRPSSNVSLTDKEEYGYIRLEDLEVISTLGVGGFGRVELVQYVSNKSMTFALKCLKKQHIVDTQQQEHVYSERNIMMACNSQFICRLYRTFRDSKYVYMLLEACLGGEVWTILRERGYFDDYTTKFVTGCVVEAFEYLHARGIIYRDLKPENLLLDNVGYVKIVDFGFSKRLGFSSKTWTFCGTPEYVAPEIILNKGHDRAVDYWSLGILMHELLTGTPPFTAPDPMRTYNIILKGIDMIDFPKHITRAAQSLIKRLCRDSPSERLGYQRGGLDDIKKHKWFQGFDWDGLKQRALGPPITPLVRGPADASNFDYYSKEMDLPPDEFSNWDAEF